MKHITFQCYLSLLLSYLQKGVCCAAIFFVFFFCICSFVATSQESLYLKIQGGTQSALFKNDIKLKKNSKGDVVEGTLATNLSAYPVHKTATFEAPAIFFNAGSFIVFNSKGQVLTGTLATNFVGRITAATAVTSDKNMQFRAGTEIKFADNSDAEVIEGTIVTNQYLKNTMGASKSYDAGTTLKFNAAGLVMEVKEKEMAIKSGRDNGKNEYYAFMAYPLPQVPKTYYSKIFKINFDKQSIEEKAKLEGFYELLKQKGLYIYDEKKIAFYNEPGRVSFGCYDYGNGCWYYDILSIYGGKSENDAQNEKNYIEQTTKGNVEINWP